MKKTIAFAILMTSLVSCSQQTADSPQSSPAASPAISTTPASSANAPFTVCNGAFALCTTAKCERRGDGPGLTVSCLCDVMQDYSVGKKSCAEVPPTPPAPGQPIASRYYPIKSMAVCTNRGLWAMCLDSPCTVDVNDPLKARCDCQLDVSLQNHVVVAATPDDAMCESALWSSASLEDVIQVTGFLYSQSSPLKPFAINIVRVGPSKK